MKRMQNIITGLFISILLLMLWAVIDPLAVTPLVLIIFLLLALGILLGIHDSEIKKEDQKLGRKKTWKDEEN